MSEVVYVTFLPAGETFCKTFPMEKTNISNVWRSICNQFHRNFEGDFDMISVTQECSAQEFMSKTKRDATKGQGLYFVHGSDATNVFLRTIDQGYVKNGYHIKHVARIGVMTIPSFNFQHNKELSENMHLFQGYKKEKGLKDVEYIEEPSPLRDVKKAMLKMKKSMQEKESTTLSSPEFSEELKEAIKDFQDRKSNFNDPNKACPVRDSDKVAEKFMQGYSTKEQLKKILLLKYSDCQQDDWSDDSGESTSEDDYVKNWSEEDPDQYALDVFFNI